MSGAVDGRSRLNAGMTTETNGFAGRVSTTAAYINVLGAIQIMQSTKRAGGNSQHACLLEELLRVRRFADDGDVAPPGREDHHKRLSGPAAPRLRSDPAPR